MLIAAFGPTTGWAGKTVTYNAGQFTLEGVGVVSAEAVLDYDRQGHLVWAYDGLREWVQQTAAQSATTPATAQSGTELHMSPRLLTMSRSTTTTADSLPMRRLGGVRVWVWGLAAAGVVLCLLLLLQGLGRIERERQADAAAASAVTTIAHDFPEANNVLDLLDKAAGAYTGQHDAAQAEVYANDAKNRLSGLWANYRAMRGALGDAGNLQDTYHIYLIAVARYEAIVSEVVFLRGDDGGLSTARDDCVMWRDTVSSKLDEIR